MAPLLPQISGFGAQSLDDMLVFSTFDWPAYALGILLGLWAEKEIGIRSQTYLTFLLSGIS